MTPLMQTNRQKIIQNFPHSLTIYVDYVNSTKFVQLPQIGWHVNEDKQRVVILRTVVRVVQ